MYQTIKRGSKLPDSVAEIKPNAANCLEVKLLKEEVVSLRAQLAEAKIKVKALENNVFTATSDTPREEQKNSLVDHFEHFKQLLRKSTTEGMF